MKKTKFVGEFIPDADYTKPYDKEYLTMTGYIDGNGNYAGPLRMHPRLPRMTAEEREARMQVEGILY